MKCLCGCQKDNKSTEEARYSNTFCVTCADDWFIRHSHKTVKVK